MGLQSRKLVSTIKTVISCLMLGSSTLVMGGAGGCGPDPEPIWLCLNQAPVGSRGLATLSENIGQVQQGLNAKPSAMWTTPKIPVCWESGAWSGVSDADKALVKKAVEDTWNTTLNADLVPADQRVQFVGFQSCDSDSNAAKNGIRITAGDVNPATQKLGNELAGLQNGMTLDFTFKTWSPVCSRDEATRQTCVYDIAVHEFGHALGLAHEQNRIDTPTTCTTKPQGEDGTTYYGVWDDQSIMNYCNPEWNNGGKLSDEDKAGILAFYYAQYYKTYCSQLSTSAKAVQAQLATSQNAAVSTKTQVYKASPAVVDSTGISMTSGQTVTVGK